MITGGDYVNEEGIAGVHDKLKGTTTAWLATA